MPNARNGSTWPFTGSTAKMLTAILMKPPPRPSELRPDVPPRLDEILFE